MLSEEKNNGTTATAKNWNTVQDELDEGFSYVDRRWNGMAHNKWIADGAETLRAAADLLLDHARWLQKLAEQGVELSQPVDGGHVDFWTKDEAVAREWRLGEVQMLVRNDKTGEQWWDLDETCTAAWRTELGIDEGDDWEEDEEDEAEAEEDEEDAG